MSRGLGRVERAVLEYLADGKDSRDWYFTRLDVIEAALGVHRESIRRAVKTLQRKGYAVTGYDNGWRVLDGEVARFWDTRSPTVRLSAEYLSTLKSDDTAQVTP
jgi:DNA-binding IclR family transcriptional regulator